MWGPVERQGFDLVTHAVLVASGVRFMEQLVGSTAAGRAVMLPDLSAERQHRITAILAERRDDEIARRSHPFGEAA